jgi:hypothetical protein
VSTSAVIAITTACIGVPLLLAASFYFMTARLVASGADQHFVDDLTERRWFGNALLLAGTGFSVVALVAFVAGRA